MNSNRHGKRARIIIQLVSLCMMMLGVVPGNDTFEGKSKVDLKNFFEQEFSTVEGLKFEVPNHATLTMRSWTIHLSAELWREKPALTKAMFKIMDKQLERVENAIPEKALEQIRSVDVWISPAIPDVQPTAAYHPSVVWLKNNNRNPLMAKCVEITNVDNFEFENVRMPYLMLHELAHAYHDQVLDFRNSKVRKAFEAARDSGGYDKVKRLVKS